LAEWANFQGGDFPVTPVYQAQLMVDLQQFYMVFWQYIRIFVVFVVYFYLLLD
jgi:hypothetical protein